MPPKWKLINTKYFTLWETIQLWTMWKDIYTQNKYFEAYKNSYWVQAIYVNIVRKQSQKSQPSGDMLKRLTTWSKETRHCFDVKTMSDSWRLTILSILPSGALYWTRWLPAQHSLILKQKKSRIRETTPPPPPTCFVLVPLLMLLPPLLSIGQGCHLINIL